MSLAAGVRLGPYEILGSLGTGGMGEVYKARDTRLDRTVAIKVLPADLANDPDLRARFEREARAIAALDHQNICAKARNTRLERTVAIEVLPADVANDPDPRDPPHGLARCGCAVAKSRDDHGR